jgi:L-erythro-3,5-diaminohexanoate dehydrogenase
VERFGTHRSIEPAGALPQQALRLDATSPLTPDELAIDVDYLNIDSASWRQLRESTDGTSEAMAGRILEIVAERGKMQNPVTGSGGMLVGTVSELGIHRSTPPVGTRIATLVSLSLTPLVIDEIIELDPTSEKVKVKGRAILFGSGIYAQLPGDISDTVSLGVLDVCGAPAWMAKLARPGMKVVVIGAGGKSGVLAVSQAAKIVGEEGRVLGLCYPEDSAVAAKEAGAEAVVVDCTDATAVAEAVSDAFMGDEADLVFLCTNVPGCEGGAILACSDQGRIMFFSMATSFTSAALLAEGLGKSSEMTIGNGYVPGHAELALDLVRNDDRLMARFS